MIILKAVISFTGMAAFSFCLYFLTMYDLAVCLYFLDPSQTEKVRERWEKKEGAGRMNALKSKDYEIVLKSAPPAVLKELTKQGYSLDTTPQCVKFYKI